MVRCRRQKDYEGLRVPTARGYHGGGVCRAHGQVRHGGARHQDQEEQAQTVQGQEWNAQRGRTLLIY